MRIQISKLSVLFLLISFLMAACFNTLSGHRGVSSNIAESKKRGVFICELRNIPNPYIINDSLQINLKFAWLEKRWAYKKNNDESHIRSGFQIVIDSDKRSITGITIDWQIGMFEESFRTAGKESIMIDIDSIPENYLFTWKVLEGFYFDSTKVIGKYEMYAPAFNAIPKFRKPTKP